MALLENLREELANLSILKTVTGAFGDIAALKIQSLKKAFEQNSLFYEQVSQLYHSVSLSAMMNKYIPHKEKQKFKYHPKTLRIALTSNHRFYGTSNRDIMDRFLDESASIHEDRLIIGLTGKDFASGKIGFPAFNVLIFQNDNPPKIEIDTLLNLCRPYERVFVYYPRFVNMLMQKVDRVDIAYSPKDVGNSYQQIKFIFEPELPKIIDFFEQHIRTLLFNRVMLETQLARTASRLLAMDTAERNAQDLIKTTGSNLRKSKQALINRRLLETFTIVQQGKNGHN
jgi:ATP synthase F1 gamma subunit